MNIGADINFFSFFLLFGIGTRGIESFRGKWGLSPATRLSSRSAAADYRGAICVLYVVDEERCCGGEEDIVLDRD